MRYSNRGQVHRCLGMCTENQVLCQKVIAYQELVALKWFINIGCYYSHCYLSFTERRQEVERKAELGISNYSVIE